MTSYRKSEAVRSLLLDTAESLFAEKGYFGVSIRDITTAAALRSASINYHFGSKENLFIAVVGRRIEPLAAARLERLESLTVDPTRPEESVRAVVEAFVEPMLEFAESDDPGWRNYCILVAHLAVQKIWSENVVSAEFDAHASQFIDAIQQTFPDAEPFRVHCAFQFLLSTLLYAVCGNERLDTLSEGRFESRDLARLRAPLYDFMTQGVLGAVGATL